MSHAMHVRLKRGSAPFGVTVRAMIFDDQGQMLLAMARGRARMTWTLPGGWLQDVETPEAALERATSDELRMPDRDWAHPAGHRHRAQRPRLDLCLHDS